ncbi:hypothetical protein AKJ16_DCAP08222 [Drosera capensis]
MLLCFHNSQVTRKEFSSNKTHIRTSINSDFRRSQAFRFRHLSPPHINPFKGLARRIPPFPLLLLVLFVHVLACILILKVWFHKI